MIFIQEHRVIEGALCEAALWESTHCVRKPTKKSATKILTEKIFLGRWTDAIST